MHLQTESLVSNSKKFQKSDTLKRQSPKTNYNEHLNQVEKKVNASKSPTPISFKNFQTSTIWQSIQPSTIQFKRLFDVTLLKILHIKL